MRLQQRAQDITSTEGFKPKAIVPAYRRPASRPVNALDHPRRSATSSFSSSNSATEASIFWRLKLFNGTFCTTSRSLPAVRIGKELMSSFSTP